MSIKSLYCRIFSKVLITQCLCVSILLLVVFPVIAAEETEIQLVDMAGRELKLQSIPERIIVLDAADCEIIYAVGAEDSLVGRGSYCDYPVEILDVPEVSSGYETNLEQIIALAPQLVVLSTMNQTPEQVLALEKAGIAVLATDADDIEGVYTAISMIGKVTGEEENAQSVIDDMQNTFAEIRQKSSLANTAPATVYFEVSPLEYGLWTAAANTFMDELAHICGLENIFADLDGWVEISQEQVINSDPDFIFSTAMAVEGAPDPVDEIMSRPGWQEMSAIKSGAVLNVDSSALTRPGPRLTDAAECIRDFVDAQQADNEMN